MSRDPKMYHTYYVVRDGERCGLPFETREQAETYRARLETWWGAGYVVEDVTMRGLTTIHSTANV